MLPRLIGRSVARPRLTPDAPEITDATERLDAKPFEFFEIAYREWFGKEPDEKALERIFMRYLYTQAAPHWVRHFARLVLLQAERGTLDPVRYGLPPKPPETMAPEDLRRWSYAACCLALGFIFFCLPAL